MSTDEIEQFDLSAGEGARSQPRVGRRALFGAVSALGLASAFGATRALAQDDDGDDAIDEDDVAEMSDEVGAVYDDFVTRLATNLDQGDAAVVDSAIRDTLAAMVEERFSAGEISRNLADELIERIQTGGAPLAVAMLGGMRGRRMQRRGRRRNGRDSQPETSETPAA